MPYTCEGNERAGTELKVLCSCKLVGTKCNDINEEDMRVCIDYIWSFCWKEKRAYVYAMINRIDKKRSYTASENPRQNLITLLNTT